MATEYIKVSEGEVKVVETVVKEETKDLWTLKQRKLELEAKIAGRRDLWVQQVTLENARMAEVLADASVAVDKEIAEWQADLDQVTAQIDGAVAAGVVEVEPKPVEEPPVEEIIV